MVLDRAKLKKLLKERGVTLDRSLIHRLIYVII